MLIDDELSGDDGFYDEGDSLIDDASLSEEGYVNGTPDHELETNEETVQPSNVADIQSTLHKHRPMAIESHADHVTKSSVSNLPVTVTAHIGSFSMSHEQIESLQVEDLILVNPHYQNKVSLRVGENEIGIGQIVSVNGDVAIQIIRLWS